MIPKRYLIATLFIAAMLVLLAVVQGPRSREQGGVARTEVVAASLETFEVIAEYRLQDGWAPRFQGTVDPDQAAPWPYAGGFETPWEPASPFLGNQGFATNGPGGRSEVLLWRGLEWRRYRFDAPIASARLDPIKGTRLLLTLMLGPRRFETQLLEVPEGRVLWSSESGPWSRFSWDGKAALLGLPGPEGSWLLSAFPTDSEPWPTTLAPWNEPGLPPAPKSVLTKAAQLWDDGADLRGPCLHLPWKADHHLWFPAWNRLWVDGGDTWTLWGLEEGTWKRLEVGQGALSAHPPVAMGLTKPKSEGRALSPLLKAEWKEIDKDAEAWPAFDAAWSWKDDTGALTAWDQRWGKGMEGFPKETQRQGLLRTYRVEWLAASALRVSVKGWLHDGPEIALREASEVAWVWVGDRVLLVRLPPSDRLRKIRSVLRPR
ncbi:MAG: hypothetical protein LWX11_02295 [Firmicutes bacterium]|nr:hypothetical protein [Bacillota bacterium]